ncbi:alpha/beta hydrolase [Pseudoteredinibacter isoporae]|uniref:alpha/beta hydrolase n=1 Tax=Pseudoteredinibacter isoporae TaxID=570281 RepID=UPI00310C8214
MIIISSRKSFNNPDELSDVGHAYREIDFSNDSVVREMESHQLLTELTGKKVLMLVHGYNNEQDEVYDAYSVIEEKIDQHIAGEFDAVIGYSWPGGDKGLEWWTSKRRANAVARRFRFLIEELSKQTRSLDVMSHSLGARVVLKALKQSQDDTVLRNYYCTAPAVDNEVLERNEEFHDSVSKNDKLFVFHSKKDGVLGGAYRLAEFDNALGLYGPEDKHYIQSKTKNIFVVNCKKRVDSHGAYKRSDAMYKYIASSLRKKPVKFKTL